MRRRRIGALAGAFVLMFGVASTALASSAGVGSIQNATLTTSSNHGDGHCDTQSGVSGDMSVQTSGANGQTGHQGDKCDPAIAIDKTADPVTLPAGGGSVTYTYAVTNAGDVPLVDVVVTDDKCSPVTGPAAGGDANSDGKLDVTETWTYSCTTTLTATTTNVGTVNSDRIDCSKSKSGGSGGSGGYGASTVQTTGQTHTGVGGGYGGNGGDGGDNDHHDPCVTKSVPPASDSATVTVATPAPQPAIAIDKTADPVTLPAGGGSVTYTYAVTNAGDVPLVDVVVTDDKCSPVTGPAAGGDANSDGKLDVTETWTYSCTTTLTATTTNVGTVNSDWIDCSKSEGDGSHPSGDSTVQTTGQTHVGNGGDDDANGGDNDDDDTCATKSVPPASDSATVTVATPAPQPAIAIDKTADPATLPAGGGSVTYTYVVTNAGDVPLIDVVVTDDKCSTVTGPAAGGDANSNNRLDVTETWTFSCTTTLTATTTNVGTVNANWDSCNDDCLVPVPPATDSATVTVALPATRPGISLDKTADPTTLGVEGGSATYSYLVTNTGNVALTAVAVWDDNGTPADISDDFQPTCPATTLDVGASMTCTALVTGIAVSVTNIATVTAKVGDTSGTVSATDSATVTVETNGGVGGETNVPVVTAPPTDTLSKTTSDPGSTLPLILIVLGIIGFAAVVLTPGRRIKR